MYCNVPSIIWLIYQFESQIFTVMNNNLMNLDNIKRYKNLRVIKMRVAAIQVQHCNEIQ